MRVRKRRTIRREAGDRDGGVVSSCAGVGVQGERAGDGAAQGGAKRSATGMAPSTDEAVATTLRRSELASRAPRRCRACRCAGSARAAPGSGGAGRSHEPIMSARSGLSQSRIARRRRHEVEQRLFGALAAVAGIAEGLVERGGHPLVSRLVRDRGRRYGPDRSSGDDEREPQGEHPAVEYLRRWRLQGGSTGRPYI